MQIDGARSRFYLLRIGAPTISFSHQSHMRFFEGEYAMAARSFKVVFKNVTNMSLTRTNLSLMHGEWSNGGNAVPPDTIAPISKTEWESESDGIGTGTQGSVTYHGDAGDIVVRW